MDNLLEARLSDKQDLIGELRDVEDAANALSQYIRAPNHPLPDEFPQLQLQEISASLSLLTSGTIEGCRIPLEYARLRLPAIRRRYLKRGAQADDHDQPAHDRGQGVDQPISELIIAVTTALDAYARYSGNDAGEPIIQENEHDVSGDQGILDAISQSEKLQSQIHETISEADSVLPSDFRENREFVARLYDVEILNKLARAELRDTVVVRWFRKIINSLRITPNKLRVLSKTIKAGIVAGRLWERFNSLFVKSTIELLEETSRNLESEALRMEGSISRNAPADFDLFVAIEELKRGRRLPSAHVPMVSALDIQTYPLRDLNSFGNLVALQDLKVRNKGGSIIDISGLRELRKLRSLRLGRVELDNLDDIGNLENLQSLYILGNIDNIDAIRYFSDLKVLQAVSANPTSWNALKACQNLRSITIKNCRSFDLDILSGLKELRELVFWDVRLGASDKLTGFDALQSIEMRRCGAVQLEAFFRRRLDINVAAKDTRLF